VTLPWVARDPPWVNRSMVGFGHDPKGRDPRGSPNPSWVPAVTYSSLLTHARSWLQPNYGSANPRWVLAATQPWVSKPTLVQDQTCVGRASHTGHKVTHGRVTLDPLFLVLKKKKKKK
jgi:hypothetical protein